MVFGALLAVSFSPTEADAFVPNAPVMMKKLEQRGVRHLDQRVRYEQVSKTGSTLWRIEIVTSTKGQVQFTRQTVQGTSVQTWIRDPRVPARAKTPIPAWVRLLVGDRIPVILASLAIDLNVTSLAKHKTTVCWVIGAGPHQPLHSQIKLQRSDGVVRRVVEGKLARRVVTEWGNPQGGKVPGPWWPKNLRLIETNQVTDYRLVSYEHGAKARVEEAFRLPVLRGKP